MNVENQLNITFKSEVLEIKFSGNNISPQIISLGEMSQNILLFHKLVKPIIEREHPDIDLDKTYVGLMNIGDRSLSYRYIIKQYQNLILSAFSTLLISINTNNIDKLPIGTIDELENISKFNEKWKCAARFGEVINDEFMERSNFTDQFKTEKLGLVKGSTTLYGIIERIGGEKPTITLVLPNKDKINVSVSKEDAVNFAPNLYKKVRINGDAVWKGKDLRLTSFVAKKINGLESTNAIDDFSFLRQKYSSYFDAIEDVDNHLAN